MKKGSKQKPEAIIKQLKTKLKKRNAEIKLLEMEGHSDFYKIQRLRELNTQPRYKFVVTQKPLLNCKLAVIALATTLVIAVWLVAIFC